MDDEKDAATVLGRYANTFDVGHSFVEFVVDCGQCYGAGDKVVHTRIVMTPPSARDLLDTLSRSIAAYEHRYGTIQDLDRR